MKVEFRTWGRDEQVFVSLVAESDVDRIALRAFHGPDPREKRAAVVEARPGGSSESHMVTELGPGEVVIQMVPITESK